MAIKKSSTIKPNQSSATVAVKSQQKVGSGFAPGSRPGVITQSGSNLFKDGKLIGSYVDTKAAASALSGYTSPGQNGRITNIQGDNQGQTFRQLNRVNKGTQTGQANVQGAKQALASRGFVSEVGVDAQGNEQVIGAQTPESAQKITQQRQKKALEQQNIAEQSQRAYVRGQPFSRQAPVTRDQTREEEAKARIAAERGIDTKTASAGQLMRLNEAVNMDVYGTAQPKFGTGPNVLTAQQKATEQAIAAKRQSKAKFSIPENLKTGIDKTVVTSKGVEEFSQRQLAQFQEYNQENSDTVSSSLDSLLSSDPDILQAEADGADMQALLEERRAFYEDQYNSLKDEIQSIYDSKEEDYKEQAAQAMGSAISQMAAMGAFGTTTAGIQYVDDVNRKNQAAIMALATEEASALNSAYSAFMEADFDIAEEMINNAKSTREEIRQIKSEQLQRQQQLMELKQMEKEEASDTLSTLLSSGMTEEDLPSGYLDYLDSKSGYPTGTSAKLFSLMQEKSAQEAAQASYESDVKRANDYLDIASKLPVGTTLQVGDSLITSINTGTITSGTESVGGRMYYWQKNQDTGELTVQDMGVQGSMKYEDYTDENGLRIRSYENGTSQVLWDPSQPSGGVATGGIISLFPTGSTGGQCGAWVNDLMNTSVGATFESKMAFTDSSITADTAQVGDMFVQNVGQYGHIGIINGKSVVNGEVVFSVSESNWNMDEKVTHTRSVKASEIAGFGRPGWRDSLYAFDSSSTTTELSDIEKSFAQRYALALTESERSSVISQAKSSGVDISKLVKGAIAMKDTLPQGIVYNEATGLAAQLPSDVSNDLTNNMSTVQKVMNLFSQYVQGEDTFSGGGTGAIQGKLPAFLQKKGTEDITNTISEIELAIRNEKFGASLTESEKEAAKQAIPSPTTSDTKNVKLLRTLVESLLTGTSNFLRQRGYSVAGYTVPVKNKSTGEIKDIPIHLYNPQDFELAL